MSKPIRNRVETLIYHPDLKKVLVAKWVLPDTIVYVYPGGGVEDGETVEQAARKECLEEVGVKIDNVSPLLIGRIKPIEQSQVSKELLFGGEVTHYVFATFKDRDLSKHNTEGDAMEYEWLEPLEAGGKVRNGSVDGEYRAQAIRIAHFSGKISF